eukprot:gnl/Dysnectes_brevis/3487_a4422_1199.p1 GENE.gnl/Dysnectes_brevis/3487_a4422_1199~~gnl/Dysnectes_brevis/3487_a4422_1199.p1  ORF type:complete len:378 (+),score=46.05 gnl/Dysnectes_brevis/3487_a4422_1199:73-1206(+)
MQSVALQRAATSKEPSLTTTEKKLPTQAPVRQASISRKKLIELTSKFIKTAPEESIVVCAQSSAERLEVEPRRVYDLFNVLEALGILRKGEKRKYHFCGTKHMDATIGRFRDKARVFSSRPHSELGALLAIANKSSNPSLAHTERRPLPPQTPRRQEAANVAALRAFQPSPCRPGRRHLTDIARAFLTLLVSSPGYGGYTLEQVGAKINCKPSQVRRLYDVANICQQLGVLRRADSRRKPAWVWNWGTRSAPPQRKASCTIPESLNHLCDCIVESTREGITDRVITNPLKMTAPSRPNSWHKIVLTTNTIKPGVVNWSGLLTSAEASSAASTALSTHSVKFGALLTYGQPIQPPQPKKDTPVPTPAVSALADDDGKE